MFGKKKQPEPAQPQQPKTPNPEALQGIAYAVFDYFNAAYPGWKTSTSDFVLLDSGNIDSFTSYVDQAPKILDFPVIEHISKCAKLAFEGIQMPKTLSLALDSAGVHQFNFTY